MHRLIICVLFIALSLGAGSAFAQRAEGGSVVLRDGSNNTVGTFNIVVGGNLALAENTESLELLRSIESLVGGLVESGDLALSGDGAESLATGLVDIAENTLFPRFVIFEDQFTLSEGTTHILRDGQTTIGFRGFHQTGPMLYINGEDVRPRSGATVEFQFDGKPCRLVNNQIERDRGEATFTVLC